MIPNNQMKASSEAFIFHGLVLSSSSMRLLEVTAHAISVYPPSIFPPLQAFAHSYLTLHELKRERRDLNQTQPSDESITAACQPRRLKTVEYLVYWTQKLHAWVHGRSHRHDRCMSLIKQIQDLHRSFVWALASSTCVFAGPLQAPTWIPCALNKQRDIFMWS